MPSIPLTLKTEKQILDRVGVRDFSDLIASIPPVIREKADFKMPVGLNQDDSGRGLSEHELRLFFTELGKHNAYFPDTIHFLGGGIYDNIIPAIVGQLALRGEFLTCYTPYQPEISQGTLQAIFEFQTLFSRLTAMPVANASMYDGATATAEAVLMAYRLSNKANHSCLIAESLHPHYRQVTETFLSGTQKPPVAIPYNESNGEINLDALSELVKIHSPDCVVIGYPNYFGALEPLKLMRDLIGPKCLLIVSISDPSALSIYEAPGNLSADIVVGEAHQLGTPMLFGGPHVGFFATKKEFIRQMPGRLCGETIDTQGNRAYTLTLSTREQHIRREKATSNICTNQGLIALRTTIYLSFLGKQGFVNLGEMNYSLFSYLSQELSRVGISPLFKEGEFYREGAFSIPHLNKRFDKALKSHIVPGIKLNQYYPRLDDALLITVNPKHTKTEIDKLVEVLSHD